jgi:hypothetical protein
VDFVWAPVKRDLEWLWVQAKRVLKLLLGDWENDVGFIGDGRGRYSRQHRDPTDPPQRELP